MKLRKIMLTLLAVLPILVIDCSDLDTGYSAKLGVMIEAGEIPDLGYIDAAMLPELASSGLLEPIPEGLVEDWGDFYPQLLPYFQHEGVTYGIPYDFQPVTLLINQQLFEMYGLEEPTTWEELIEAAAYIQEAERQAGNPDFYGLGLTAGIWNFLPFLYQANGSLLNENGELALDTEQAQDAFLYYTGLSRNGLAFPAYIADLDYYGAYGGDGTIAKFERGEIAMCFGATSIYYNLKLLQTPVKAIEPPEMSPGSGRATMALVRGYGLFKGSNPTAKEFLGFLSSPEAMERWIGDSDTPLDHVPARASLRDKWLTAHPDTTAFMNAVEYLPEDLPTVSVSFDGIQALRRLAADKISMAMQPDVSDDDALALLEELRVEGNAILQAAQD